MLPVAALSAVILFIASLDIVFTGLYRFNTFPFAFGGVPLFHIVLGAGAGIIVMNYMKKEFIKKFVLVLFFFHIALTASYISETLGASTLLGLFNQLSDFFQNFVMVSLLVWISEGLWGNKIYKEA